MFISQLNLYNYTPHNKPLLVLIPFYSLTHRGRTTNDLAQVDNNYNISGAASDVLQTIEIPIVSGKDCREEYRIFKKDTQLCAGAEAGKLRIISILVHLLKCHTMTTYLKYNKSV